MAYDDFKEGCSVIKDYVDDQNTKTAGKIPTKVSELTNDSNYATESYVNTAIGNIAQPSSLPQTYKKKAVTLATSGWHGEQTDAWNGSVYIKDGTKSFQLNKNCMAFGAKMTIKTSSTSTTLTGTLSEDSTKWTYPQTRIDSLTTIISATLIGSEVTMTFSSMSGKTYTSISFEGDTEPRYSYTDADVKVNSEVRFTLDEANGKLAGQFGLKKTIDKEAGKLTFTADTLPTSAITGTLEIGETSTEGAAFVEGISSDTDIPQRTTKDTTLTAAGWTNNQQEVSVGDLSPTDDVSPIFATDSAEQAYKDAEITGKIGTNKVVFTCQSVPTADIPLTLVITRW